MKWTNGGEDNQQVDVPLKLTDQRWREPIKDPQIIQSKDQNLCVWLQQIMKKGTHLPAFTTFVFPEC